MNKKGQMSESGKDIYKQKCKQLRRTIIETVHLNSALSSEIARTESKVNAIKLERKYLLKKLMQYEKPKMNCLGGFSKSKSEVMKGKTKFDKSKKGQNLKSDISRISNLNSVRENVIRVKPINVDQCGRPIFPIEIGPLSIYSIGEIINDRLLYHTNQYIFPVGYCSTRLCPNMSSPGSQSLYTCKVVDDGHQPKFEISPEDAPENSVSSHCIGDVYCRFQNLLGPNTHDLSNVDAFDFFGFSCPTVQNLIQSLPGACRCVGYEWKKIEIIQPGNGGVKSKPKGRIRQSDINIEALEKWARDT